MMNFTPIRLAAPAVLLALACSGTALALDSSAPILCASVDVHECVDGGRASLIRPAPGTCPRRFRRKA